MRKIIVSTFCTFALLVALSFVSTPLEISANTEEPNIEVNSSAPRSTHVVAVKSMYYGPYIYQTVNRHGTLYRGYLKLDYTSMNLFRYSGPLYRHDISDYPIPSKLPEIELELNK